jgi:PEP-CTERM motif
MRTLLSTFALLSALALPVAAHAATFDFSANGGGGGFSGSGVLDASSNGDGSYTIDGISGTDVTGFVPAGAFDHNDNLLFPGTSSLVDADGFAFTANQGDTDFTVDIFSPSAGVYDAYFLDSDGFSATIPVAFTLATAATPEPSSVLLMGTGMLALAALGWRRLMA